MKQHTINKIFEHHAAALTGLSQHQRDAVLNALGAAYTAGNQARPDYDPPTMLDGDTSEKLTPSEQTLKAVFEQAGPVPDALDDFLNYLHRVDMLKREGAGACEVVA